jgi:hypothetical protein
LPHLATFYHRKPWGPLPALRHSPHVATFRQSTHCGRGANRSASGRISRNLPL